MRSFTSYLNKSIRPQWKDYYLDYLSLKNLLEKFADRRTKINDKTDISHIERFYFVAEASKSFEISTSHDFNLMTNSVASDDCDNLTTSECFLFFYKQNWLRGVNSFICIQQTHNNLFLLYSNVSCRK